MFAHGGGFVFCDLDSHDDLCRAMTNGVGAIVVSVDYRLAPESPWPAAADDVYAVADWVAEHAEELGADPAAHDRGRRQRGRQPGRRTALLARDRGRPAIAGQLLIYPAIAADFGTESYRTFGTGYYNTAAAMAWYWDQYVPDLADRSHPTASPMQARVGRAPAGGGDHRRVRPAVLGGRRLRESPCRRVGPDDPPELRGRDPRLHDHARPGHLPAGPAAGLGDVSSAVPLIGMSPCRD